MRSQSKSQRQRPAFSAPVQSESAFQSRSFGQESASSEAGERSTLFNRYLQRRQVAWGERFGAQRTSSGIIQTKLTLGGFGDKYEQEADQVAKQVISHLNAPLNRQPSSQPLSPTAIQRTATIQSVPTTHGISAVDLGIERTINQARGSGQPLAEGLRAPMEQAFGADFSGVRVHTDAQSDSLNRSLQARAFTTGQDIFFRQGAYRPHTSGGQQLLAHELTHVVQQNGGAVPADRIQLAGDKELSWLKIPTFFYGHFAAKVRGMAGSISNDEIRNLWKAFIKSAFQFRTEGVGSPGKYSEEERQKNVEQYYQAASKFLHLFGPISAKEGTNTLLWSNYGIGRMKANLVAGGTPLNETQIGQLFDILAITGMNSPLGWAESYNIWSAVSKEFAANAKGDVHVYVPQGITTRSIFWDVELPELRVRQWSGQVSNIFIHYLKTLEAFNSATDKQAFLSNDANWVRLSVEKAPIFSQPREQSPQSGTRSEAGSPILMTPEKLKMLTRVWREKGKRRASMK